MAPPRRPAPNRIALYLGLLVWAALLIVPLFLSPRREELGYGAFKQAVAEGAVESAAIARDRVEGRFKEAAGRKPRDFVAVRVDDPRLFEDLSAKGVEIRGIEDSGFFRSLGPWLLPLVALGFLFFLRGGSGALGQLSFARSKARLYAEHEVKVTFADVAGVDEAREELTEVVRFLKEPQRFSRLGGRIPKGILLVGPPGTGKTLLARAVAGEAGVPFLSISGSEFVELFVGVGAARVRDLFAQAKSLAPSIIFIDELDALGRTRAVSIATHEEREQALNQLLVELDGFDPRSGVILMAATNRPEILDPALLRAGRFDRHVTVDRPDKKGRLDILRVHARTLKLDPAADLDALAGMTVGLAGADLANLLNEAALLAVRREKESISQAELTEALTRVVAGLERKSRVLSPPERERVAIHEIGHALLALALPGADPVQRISIIPRGVGALGYTLQLPAEDRFLRTRPELLDRVAVLLGGRVAEELALGEVSTGAQDDLRKATDLARSMVRSFGMGEKLANLSLEGEGAPFLGIGPPVARGDYGDETAREIDREVQAIVEQEHARAREMLSARTGALREGAKLLLARETLAGEELAALLPSPTSKGDGVSARPPPSIAGPAQTVRPEGEKSP
jgi:cell division protease FtsH